VQGFPKYAANVFVCYRFAIVPMPGCPQSVCNMFSMSPTSGTIGPNDKPLPVQICVVPKRELTIRDQTILHCRVIEPKARTSINAVSNNNASDSLHSTASIPEAIANIPIRVSIQSSYSRHVLYCFSS